ncbi:MAG: T9SS type A sorting domain-containing protein, partial [Bacteroidetes bacterium]|nr:T9SS type A sorting domain-containing protein [Bacteroidota bacterium]
AKIVHEEAESILASLAPYNVTTAKMQALSAAIARYEELIGRRGSGKAILHAGAEIDFMPGTEVTYGSELDAYIQPYSCSNNIARMAYQANDDAAGEDNFVTTANRQPLETPDIKKKECNIKVYPNPTTGRLVIEIDSDDLNSDVILSDLAGKALFKTHISDSGRFEINLDRQNNGIYLLDVRNGKKREVFKIILAR